mmetsp:Transcript_15103/g.29155  ORF Transcript_15103/g.29155 Transcript_15103/m.29155 type:complete len:103 (+) Transcript_15103:114-422(+)
MLAMLLRLLLTVAADVDSTVARERNAKQHYAVELTSVTLSTASSMISASGFATREFGAATCSPTDIPGTGVASSSMSGHLDRQQYCLLQRAPIAQLRQQRGN